MLHTSSREDIHVHVQSEGEEAGGVVADHSKGQDTRQSTIAIQTEVDEDAITVSWQVPRHNNVGGAHICTDTASNPSGAGGRRGKRMTSHAHNDITHTYTCIRSQ